MRETTRPAASCALLLIATVLPATGATIPVSAQEGSEQIGIWGAYFHMPITYRVQLGTAAPARLVEVAHAAIGAWENGARAYAAANPHAAHLADLRLVRAPAGAPADIDVVLGATAAGLGGLGGLGISFGEPMEIPRSFAYAPAAYAGPCSVGTVCAGLTGFVGPISSPAPSMSEATFYYITIHELGHALGLNHATTGTMFPTARLEPSPVPASTHCFRDIELRGLAAAYGWLASGSPQLPPGSVLGPGLAEGPCVPLAAHPRSTPFIPGAGGDGIGECRFNDEGRLEC